MGRIYVKPVIEAYAEISDKRVNISLYYGEAGPQGQRIKADPSYGFSVYKTLIEEGHARIADCCHPLRSPAGGIIYILDDGTVPAHRRDGFAPTHKWQQSIPAGFPQNNDQTLYPAETARVEGAELVLLTKNYELLLPEDDDTAAAVAERAARLVNLPLAGIKYVPFEYKDGPDTLHIYEGDRHVSSTRGHLDFFWESEAAITLLRPCFVHYNPSDIIAVDTEGRMESGVYNHYRRETFMLKPDDIRGKRFGDHLDGITVFKPVHTEDGTRVVIQPENDAKEPYNFKPDDMLSRMLYTPLWRGKPLREGSWLKHFLEFHRSAMEVNK